MTEQEIYEICQEYNITNYTINDDGSIDVNGTVELSYKDLFKLPLKFNKVSGDFYCDLNKLTDLIGGPKWVGGNFDCSSNKLTTLSGGPTEVVGNFSCTHNKLTNLFNGPESVGLSYDCSYNKLTLLSGGPKSVGEDFYCTDNKLTDLRSGPKKVEGKFHCHYNNIIDLYWFDTNFNGKFYCTDNPICDIISNGLDYNSIRLFNSLKIIKGKKVNLKRLKYFKSEFNKYVEIYHIKNIEKYYTII